MHVAFELSMPGNNAWNGRWTGEGNLYVRVLTVSNAKTTRAKFEKLFGHHSYARVRLSPAYPTWRP